MSEDYFETLSEEHDIPIEVIKSTFDEKYEKIARSPRMEGKSDIKIRKAVKQKMMDYFRNVRNNGEKFVHILFGASGRPRNWNEKLLKEIKIKANAGRIDDLLAEGKIMYMMDEDGNKVPVKEIRKKGKRTVYIRGSDKYIEPVDEAEEFEETYVIDGIPLREGEKDVIPRDNRMYTGGGNINFSYTDELIPNYSNRIYGIGYRLKDPDDTRIFSFNIRNNQADPQSNQYIWKQYKPFKPYVAEFAVDENVDGSFKLSYRGKYNPKNAAIKGVSDENIDDVIEMNLDDMRKRSELNDWSFYIPPVIYVDGVKDFHMKTRAVLGSDGKPEKTKSGWDKVNWDNYAILYADLVNGRYSTEYGKSNWYQFTDGDTSNVYNAFGDDGLTNTEPIKFHKPILATITTGRGTTRYDRKSGKKVIDPENADISINVHAIRELPPIEIEFEDDFEDF